eukprot:TRINITY_DN20044_c0_g3_i1.p2 TRINITY_DN20044_c0_g3~~TRINITY_DN20044_c0_g3_i1.p2  ORF type:complete len:204 (+),score=47.00 TRINITY_DN20044_c0_g3_i1:137-748(+)
MALGGAATSPEQVRRKWDALLAVINNVSADGDQNAASSPHKASSATAAAARELLQQSGSIKASRVKVPKRRHDWDDRHHLLFSEVNGRMHKNVRAYFDRPRDTEGYGLKHRPTLRTTWQLDTTEVQMSPEEEHAFRAANRAQSPLAQEAQGSLSKSHSAPGLSASLTRRGPWDGRHHVMFDKDNHHYHPNFREYFERPRQLMW